MPARRAARSAGLAPNFRSRQPVMSFQVAHALSRMVTPTHPYYYYFTYGIMALFFLWACRYLYYAPKHQSYKMKKFSVSVESSPRFTRCLRLVSPSHPSKNGPMQADRGLARCRRGWRKRRGGRSMNAS